MGNGLCLAQGRAAPATDRYWWHGYLRIVLGGTPSHSRATDQSIELSRNVDVHPLFEPAVPTCRPHVAGLCTPTSSMPPAAAAAAAFFVVVQAEEVGKHGVWFANGNNTGNISSIPSYP